MGSKLFLSAAKVELSGWEKIHFEKTDSKNIQ